MRCFFFQGKCRAWENFRETLEHFSPHSTTFSPQTFQYLRERRGYYLQGWSEIRWQSSRLTQWFLQKNGRENHVCCGHRLCWNHTAVCGSRLDHSLPVCKHKLHHKLRMLTMLLHNQNEAPQLEARMQRRRLLFCYLPRDTEQSEHRGERSLGWTKARMLTAVVFIAPCNALYLLIMGDEPGVWTCKVVFELVKPTLCSLRGWLRTWPEWTHKSNKDWFFGKTVYVSEWEVQLMFQTKSPCP